MDASSQTSAFASFRPQLLRSLRDYDRERFFKDLTAGATVGIVALPLAMAFAMASGLRPEAGIFTAVIAGFLISLLGGSRVQIGGPAGAFIVIVYGILERYGLSNLIVATAMSGVMLFVMGLLKLGTLIRFIPIAVVIGFTNGIAVLIGLSQIKDFLGLKVTAMPADFFGILSTLSRSLSTVNPHAVAIAVVSLSLIVLWQAMPSKIFPDPALRRRLSVLPGSVIALILTTLSVWLLDLQVDTIGSRFGGIASALPSFAWPDLSWNSLHLLIVPATTLALLGAIESLLCARVADNMIGSRHNPNQELMAQGIANVITPFFGGMPATGTIARTVTNIKSGATSPVAGIVHALTLLLIVLVAAPLAQNVPLATLAAILMFVAWNMGEWRAFVHLRQYRIPYRITLLAVFFLTVVFDLTLAVKVGLIAACLTFIYRISSLTRCEPVSALDQPLLRDQSGQVSAYRLYGALFFGAVKLIETIEASLPRQVLVLDLKNIIYVDSSGADSLLDLVRTCRKNSVRLIVCGLNTQPLDIARRSGLLDQIAAENLCPDLAGGLALAAAPQAAR
ncbi:MAG: SulP family inorganic anion transporter [Burkholderiaceae bacterium]